MKLTTKLTLNSDDMARLNPSHGDIIFNAGGKEIITLKSNGDIFVKGELVENNKEVVDGLKEFLKVAKEDKG
ncbi:hypothetical protein JFU54_28505 [Bacillus sp. TH19]|uniref:hypothetical protein n=1 Tax=Bacillus sp. TH19 TaxID=2796385 RepID=UPI0019129D4F|nr:hypothetical protein [Bacillus sp. TH19]MBK5474328.1 hypothetical protein [Bacillus sp. TH19]